MAAISLAISQNGGDAGAKILKNCWRNSRKFEGEVMVDVDPKSCHVGRSDCLTNWGPIVLHLEHIIYIYVDGKVLLMPLNVKTDSKPLRDNKFK